MTVNHGLQISCPGELAIVELPFRRPIGDELAIRVRFAALCGSDIKLYAGTYTAPHEYPIVIGHEWVGEVEGVGPQASAAWRVGDVVTGECSVFCGKCDYCLRNPNHCRQIEKKGITQDGACARHILVGERHLHRCPRLPDLRPLALTEPLAVAVQGISRRVPADDLPRARRALVIGCGGIGIMSTLVLSEAGVPDIAVRDIVEDKLDIVRSFGLPGVTASLPAAASDHSLGDGFDLVVDAAGGAGTLAAAIEQAAPCATVVCLGHQGRIELDFGAALRKSLTIVASLGSCGGFPRAIDLIERHQESIRRMITRIVPLQDAPAFFKHELIPAKGVKTLIDLG
jgi:threonine dehydrogenase-like Zn-dependent dehydrogenase